MWPIGRGEGRFLAGGLCLNRVLTRCACSGLQPIFVVDPTHCVSRDSHEGSEISTVATSSQTFDLNASKRSFLRFS